MKNKEFLEYIGVLGKKNKYDNLEGSEIEICDIFRKMNKLEGMDIDTTLRILDDMIHLRYSLDKIEYVYTYWKKLTSIMYGISWENEIYHLREIIYHSYNDNIVTNLNDHKSRIKGFLKIKLDGEYFTIAKDYTLIGKRLNYKNAIYIAFSYDTDYYEVVYGIGSVGNKSREFNQDLYNMDKYRLKIWIKE